MADEVDYEDDQGQEIVAEIKKGRGHNSKGTEESNEDQSRGGTFERVEQESTFGPIRSIDGWVVIATNIHPEATEDDLLDKFSEYGQITNLHLNRSVETGDVKGYALLEYGTKEEASHAIKDGKGSEMLGQEIGVDWAFRK